MSDMDELVKDFLVESHENLDRLDREFVDLEQDPTNRSHLGSIFRAVHTIKGTSGFFGFEKLEKLTHAGESLLSKLRDGKLTLHGEMATTLLAMVDGVRGILRRIEKTKEEGADDFAPLIQRLERLQEVPVGVDAAATSTAPLEAKPGTPPPVAAAPAGEGEYLPDTRATESAAKQSESGAILRPTETTTAVPDTQALRATETGPVDAKVDIEAQTRAVLNEAHGVADTTIRVDVGLLDQLMNLVGELVLVRNRILQTQSSSATDAQASTQRLNALTTELQESVMKTRMQPIGNVWSKFPRVVRDLAKLCGKQVRIEMEGKETELDKSLIEAIKDPLTHIVRNSIDHGIEKPDARIAHGKPGEGVLKLRAFHEGGMVIIEIADDGAGLDVQRIKAKAIEKNLINKEQAAKLGERDLLNLIFLPGFSTAEKVTNISGRGVGMDVVRTNIERIGGTVDIQTTRGVGTTMRIKIPLTLAIVPALIVQSGGERFAIPQVSLLELVRLDGEQVKTGIEVVYGAPIHRLRGQLLPLVYLNRELALDARNASEVVNIVVLQADERVFGLVVDAVCDSEEIVVKPLSKLLKSLNVFAGATIMGDGQVALILDVLGLGQRAHVVGESRDRGVQLAGGAAAHGKMEEERQVVLVFQSPDDGRMAIPIKRVARLEELDIKTIERTGDSEVVQYRGTILPLVRVFDVLPERRQELRNPEAGVTGDLLPVVVVTHGSRSFGLVVGRILDTVEIAAKPARAASRAGILGCQVINEKITEILDVEAVLRTALPESFTDTVVAKV